MKNHTLIILSLLTLATALTACGDDNNLPAIANTENENNQDNNENNQANNQTNNAQPNNQNNNENNAQPNNNNNNTGAPDGTACANDDACAGGTCLADDDGYQDGQCTTLGCADGIACQGDAQCAFLDAERTESACFARCDDVTACRDGYDCRTFGDLSFCLPTPPAPIDPQPDGSPCASREECQGGTCLSEEDGFPGGMCTTVSCRNRNDCSGEGTACLIAAQPSYCIELCEGADDCRNGYICQPVQGAAYCAPSPTAGTAVPQEGDLPFNLVCTTTFRRNDAFQGGLDLHVLDFTISEGTSSFMVVPYSPGGQIYPSLLKGPTGELNMFDEYSFALANASFLINMSPLLVPQAPQFASFVVAGDYSFEMASTEDLCFYVLQKSNLCAEVDLNIHFVGAGGLTAANANTNANFQRALTVFDEIYGQIGTRIRNIRYTDVTGADASRYRIIRNQEAAFRLVTEAEAPGESIDELLSINVFFIDDFAIQGGSVLGISAGLPGAAGFHGGRGSGLVFSAATLSTPDVLGQVLAHEVGHYLGLFHTTEQGAQGADPIEDTPACPRNQWNNPGRCPDINNLMFPFAGNNHTTLTPNQSSVIHANPLVK